MSRFIDELRHTVPPETLTDDKGAIIGIREFRASMSEILRDCRYRHTTYVVTDNGKTAAVLLSPEKAQLIKQLLGNSLDELIQPGLPQNRREKILRNVANKLLGDCDQK